RLNDRQLTQLRRDRVGFIFQAFNLVPTLSAEQNIELPVSLARKKIDRQWKDGVVESLDPGGRLQRRPHALSGGQPPRAVAERALLTRPAITSTDETTRTFATPSSAH